MDEHAQKEIRIYAEKMGDIAKKVAPIAYEAFEDYKLKSLNFSRLELDILKENLNFDNINEKYLNNKIIKGRELEEFLDKLKRLQ